MSRYKKKKGRFVGIPYHVAISDEFCALTPGETKLLFDLLVQYTGRNNGALTPAHALLRKRGWASSSLHRAFTGLKKKGFVVVTRQGWKQRGRPTLVAITFLCIDESNAEYDEGLKANPVPSGAWKNAKVLVLKAPAKTKELLTYGNEPIVPIPYRRI